MHNRLCHNAFSRHNAPLPAQAARDIVPVAGVSFAGFIALLLAGFLGGCDDAPGGLAPYEGSRTLSLQQVTQSHTPAISWVGGRVAAVGANTGARAALDSTLVWLASSTSNDISSSIAVGTNTDADKILQFGGAPVDSLPGETEYTFWIAELEALEAGLDPAAATPFSFADTTLTLSYLLRGRSGGDPLLEVEFKITRNQTLTSDQFTVTWTPADVAFRRIAIRNASVGGFDNLSWHVLIPDDEAGSISQPVVIGQTPPGAVEAVPWPTTGFTSGTYTLWMVTADWPAGEFGRNTPGYYFFQIFSNNF